MLTATKMGKVTLLLLASASVLGVVAVSPLALKALGSLHGWNWTQLSNIGQAYGAASALLTGLALIGVAASIILQVREMNAAREQSSREHHAHLLEMALQDPVYQRCWGVDPSKHTADAFRQRGYLNLIVSYWQRDYRVNGISDLMLRSNLTSLFRGEAARKWWTNTRNYRISAAVNHRDKRFCRIIDKEFRKAVSSGPPTVAAEAPDAPTPVDYHITRKMLIKTGAAMLIGAFGGAILGRSYSKT
jgi:hypothetical protein